MSSTDQCTWSGPTRDAGLQAERTALAWNRTSLAVMANAVIALRSGWATERSAITALAAALLVAGAATFAYGLWRRRQLLDASQPNAPSADAIAGVALIALAACAVEVVSVLAT